MKKFKYIQQEISLLEELSNKYDKQVAPCTIEEVNRVELMLPFPYHLPIAYREFLLGCGKNMAEVFDPFESGYISVTKHLNNQNSDIKKDIRFYDEDDKIPPDLLVIETVVHCGNYTYLLLSEGDNPPVYFWEEGEGGLKFSEKLANSFSDYFLKEIKTKAKHLTGNFVREKIEVGKAPRGKQFWIPEAEEYSQGVSTDKLLYRLGLSYLKYLDQAKAMLGLDTNSYLEELSGWKARQVGDEIRFFPPSYLTPEEKELELQNQLESKRLELAKVEKIIANLTNRIKNLSGGKLTGGRSINFNNSSALRIKELELDLRKQKVNRQKLEKEIRSLEEDSK